MYHISFSNKFKKDYKLCKKKGYDVSKLEEVLSLLERDGRLPEKYKPHTLKGGLSNLKS